MTDNNFGKPSNSKKQNLHPLILALVLAGGILLGYMVSINTVEKPSILQKYNYNKIEDVIKYIDNNYVDSLNVKDLENKAIENFNLKCVWLRVSAYRGQSQNWEASLPERLLPIMARQHL